MAFLNTLSTFYIHLCVFVTMFFFWFLVAATGEEARDIVKEGGCALLMFQDILAQQWRNQYKEGKRYFHMFQVHHKSVAGWSILTTSPYKDIFIGKFNQMEQAGIMDRLHRQYLVSKPMEPEVRVVHFQICIFILCFNFR